MISILITQQNTFLDLDEKQQIIYKINNPIFEDGLDFSDITYPFNIPNSSKNRKIFSFIDSLGAFYENVVFDAQLYINKVLFEIGVIQVQKATEKNFRIVFKAKTSAIKAKLEGLKLSDIDTSIFTKVYPLMDALNYLDNPFDENFAYRYANNGVNNAPFIYAKDLLTHCLSLAGVQNVTGDFITSPVTSDVVFCLMKNPAVLPQTSVSDFLQQMAKTFQFTYKFKENDVLECEIFYRKDILNIANAQNFSAMNYKIIDQDYLIQNVSYGYDDRMKPSDGDVLYQAIFGKKMIERQNAEKTLQLLAPLGPLRHNAYIPINIYPSIVSDSRKNDQNDYSLKMAIYKGLIFGKSIATPIAIPAYNPIMTNQLDFRMNADFVTIYNNDTSIFTRFFVPWANFLSKQKTITIKAPFSIVAAQKLDLTKPLYFANHYWVVKNVQLKFNNAVESLSEPAEMELVKIEPN